MAAAAQSQTLKDEVTCSICLEYFKNPVSIDCGHIFCQSCISQSWHGLDTNFACPQCRATSQEKNFRPNRQLGNIVEMLKLHLPTWNPQEKVCEKHQQRLQLFCQEDLEPICVVCDRSRDHRAHNVIPVEEAAQEYKKKLQKHLIQMKKDQEDVTRLSSEENKKEADLKGEFQSQKEIIFGTFEELQQFLEKEKQDFLSHLEKEHQEILEKIRVKQDDLGEKNSSFMEQITEMEGKCLQEDVEFLMGVKSDLNRAIITPENVEPHFQNFYDGWAIKPTNAVGKMASTPSNWYNSDRYEVDFELGSIVFEHCLQDSRTLNTCVQEKITNLKERFPAELQTIYRKNLNRKREDSTVAYGWHEEYSSELW